MIENRIIGSADVSKFIERGQVEQSRDEANPVLGHRLAHYLLHLSGPTMFARIGVMQALNRGQVREFNPSQKHHHWGRRKLRRDQ